MISYDPKAWFTFIFRVHRSETLRVLAPLLLAVAGYAAVVVYWSAFFASESFLQAFRSLEIVYSTLGFTVSLLLVFRTNTAYDRWWEGRKLWGGLVNVTRNLGLEGGSLASQVEPQADIQERFFGYLRIFPRALMFHLRDQRFAHANEALAQAAHQPLFVSQEVLRCIEQMAGGHPYTDFRLLRIVPLQQELMNICGACERIKNTPIPFIYSVFIKKFIFVYVMIFPWVYSSRMSGLCVVATVFVLYVLASLELIAEEVENPFNGDAHDLPLEQLCEVMGRSMDQLEGAPKAP